MQSLKENLDEALKNNTQSTVTPDLPKQGLDVFISYSSLNKAQADAVVSDFENNGIRCWYAPRDIMPGQEWVTAIHEAINSCKLFVLIYTDSSNESKQVANEVALAFNSGKTLIPFKLSDTQMSSELEYYLTRVHWLDAVDPPLLESIANLRKYSQKILAGNMPKESKIRNSNSTLKRTVPTYFLYPVIAVLVILLCVAIILLVNNNKADKDKTDLTGITDITDQTGSNGSNTDPGQNPNTNNPTVDPSTIDDTTITDITDPSNTSNTPDITNGEVTDVNALYKKAYDLQTESSDENRYEHAYEIYLKTGDTATDDPKIAEAMYMLGLKFCNGDEVNTDYDKGLRLYEKAAASGYISAYNQLGSMYLTGMDIDQDYEKAIMYYEKSAANNNAIGIYCLATMYENGQGVEADMDKAIELYKIAAELDHRDAKSALKRLEDQK